MQCRGNIFPKTKNYIQFIISYNLECKLNVHKRCTRNVANDCGLDKKRLASVLADLNINTEPQKMVKVFFPIYFLSKRFWFILF